MALVIAAAVYTGGVATRIAATEVLGVSSPLLQLGFFIVGAVITGMFMLKLLD